jgi:hypothetical protein
MPTPMPTPQYNDAEDDDDGEAARIAAERKRLIQERRNERKRQLAEKRRKRAGHAAKQDKSSEDRLKREEEASKREADDKLIRKARKSGGGDLAQAPKFQTDRLYTDTALQRELALASGFTQASQGQLTDPSFCGDAAVMMTTQRSATSDGILGRRGDPTSDWKRMDATLTHAADGSFDPSDVAQGRLGDCWFISAMAVVATRPELMKKVFVTSSTNPEGYYVVRIFKYGRWHNVVVDNTMLVQKQSGQPVCVHSKRGDQLWPALLEKAYSKFHGSYEAISGGQVHVGLADLTGGVAEYIQLDQRRADITSGALFQEIKAYYDAGYLMGAGSPSGSDTDISEKGIVQGHAYSVLNVAEESDSHGTHKLIQLRNPWGAGEWTGKWSDLDQRSWTSRMKTRLHYNPAVAGNDDDGAFWMSFQDFCRNYSTISLCRVFRSIKDKNGKKQQGGWYHATMQAEWEGENTRIFLLLARCLFVLFYALSTDSFCLFVCLFVFFLGRKLCRWFAVQREHKYPPKSAVFVKVD